MDEWKKNHLIDLFFSSLTNETIARTKITTQRTTIPVISTGISITDRFYLYSTKRELHKKKKRQEISFHHMSNEKICLKI